MEKLVWPKIVFGVHCAYCARENTDDARCCRVCGAGMATELSLNIPEASPLNASDRTLDIQGTIHTKGWKVGFAIAFVGLGIFLIYLPLVQGVTSGGFHFHSEIDILWPITSFIIAAWLPYNKYIYVDFADRQIVIIKNYGPFEISKLCRPFTDFCIVVGSLRCCNDGLGPYTFKCSVGLKPVDRVTVLWVRSFLQIKGELPRAAYEFARKLQEMTGLPDFDERINTEREIARLIVAIRECPDYPVNEKIRLIGLLGGKFCWGTQGFFSTSCCVVMPNVNRVFPSSKAFANWVSNELLETLVL